MDVRYDVRWDCDRSARGIGFGRAGYQTAITEFLTLARYAHGTRGKVEVGPD